MIDGMNKRWNASRDWWNGTHSSLHAAMSVSPDTHAHCHWHCPTQSFCSFWFSVLTPYRMHIPPAGWSWLLEWNWGCGANTLRHLQDLKRNGSICMEAPRMEAPRITLKEGRSKRRIYHRTQKALHLLTTKQVVRSMDTDDWHRNVKESRCLWYCKCKRFC